MAYPYVNQADAEARLGVDTVRAICDDDSNGTADPLVVARLCKDASSKVASYLRGIYDLALIAATPPEEVIRLTLDVLEAYAAKRHSAYVQKDWKELMKAAESDLMRLRKGETRLDVVGSPEPAANQRTYVASSSTDPSGQPRRVFDDMGDF